MSTTEQEEVARLTRELEAARAITNAAEERARAAEERAGALAERISVIEERANRTTFPQLLVLCHHHLSENLQVHNDQSLTLKGSITSPKGKKHPSRLLPWDDFPQQQQQQQQRYFDVANSFLCPVDRDPPACLVPALVIEDLGRTLCRRPLASERDLEHYERFAVEEKVKDVMGQSMTMPEANDLINSCKGLEFGNHLNPLSDDVDEVLERQKRSRVDRACVFSSIDGGRRGVYACILPELRGLHTRNPRSGQIDSHLEDIPYE